MVRVQEREMNMRRNGLRLKNQCGSAAACVFDWVFINIFFLFFLLFVAAADMFGSLLFSECFGFHFKHLNFRFFVFFSPDFSRIHDGHAAVHRFGTFVCACLCYSDQNDWGTEKREEEEKKNGRVILVNWNEIVFQVEYSGATVIYCCTFYWLAQCAWYGALLVPLPIGDAHNFNRNKLPAHRATNKWQTKKPNANEISAFVHALANFSLLPDISWAHFYPNHRD